MKKISLLIPVYFEQEVVEMFILETTRVLESLEYDYEILFIDDGSKDATTDIIKKEIEKNPKLKLIVFSYNQGKAFAFSAGLDHVEGDYIIYMDPDLQDPPEEIPNFIHEIEKGYDLVWGVRKEKKDKAINRLYSKIFWKTLDKFTGLELPRNLAVMRIFNKKFADELKRYRETNRFIEGLFCVVGMHQSKIVIEQRDRFAGVSKFNFRKKMNLALDAIFDFSELPLRMTIRMGFIIASLGLFGMIAILISRFYVDFQAGWPSVIGIVILGLGIQLIFLGVVALYIGRIYKETKNRPLYSIKEKVNL